MAQPDTVPLSDLVFTATHSVHHGLLQLSERLGQNLTDLQRREYLLQYIAQARTLLGRLLALSRWSAARMPEVQRASDALAELDRRQIGMRKMADELFFLHEALPAACAPPYDVRAAVDVLGSGRYSQLPRTIETAVPGYRKPPPTEAETLAALDWLRGELRARRAHWRLPAGARLREARGCVVCTLPGEYELSLTAEPKDDETPWKVVQLRLLVGSAEAAKLTTFSGASIDVEQLAIKVGAKVQKLLDGTEVFGSDGSIIPAQSLQAKARAADIAAGRAAAGVAFADGPDVYALPEQPLLTAHAILHAASADLAVEVLHAQATALSRAQWNGFLTVGRANDGALALSYSFPLDDGAAGGGGGGGGGSFRKRGIDAAAGGGGRAKLWVRAAAA